MEGLAAFLFVISICLWAFGGIWFLIVTFQESVGWGLGCLFVPFVSLIFLILHWDVAKKPFLVSLLGTVTYIMAIAAQFS